MGNIQGGDCRIKKSVVIALYQQWEWVAALYLWWLENGQRNNHYRELSTEQS